MTRQDTTAQCLVCVLLCCLLLHCPSLTHERCSPIGARFGQYSTERGGNGTQLATQHSSPYQSCTPLSAGAEVLLNSTSHNQSRGEGIRRCLLTTAVFVGKLLPVSYCKQGGVVFSAFSRCSEPRTGFIHYFNTDQAAFVGIEVTQRISIWLPDTVSPTTILFIDAPPQRASVQYKPNAVNSSMGRDDPGPGITCLFFRFISHSPYSPF
ncbi:hypothetical protein BJ170DRAFT_592209 [Xylariales sp. AK1849]|nr:hypothetical protein BJ170DRAFT_592209 [Xylariales sp. AK1849]